MKQAISYLKTLALMLEARSHGDEGREDCLLDKLDVIWLKLSKSEVALIDRISMYVARDRLSLSDLKKLVARLEREHFFPFVTVRVYAVQRNKKTVQKKDRTIVFRLPGSADVGRISSTGRPLNFAETP